MATMMKCTLWAGPLLLLAACSGGGDGNDESTAQPVALVSIGRAEAGTGERMIKLYGAAEAGAGGTAALVASAEATVVAVVAPIGTRVSRGQLVVQLAAGPTTRIDLVKASADARSANAAYARQQRLRGDGLVSDAEVESARATAQSAGAVFTSLSSRAGALSLRASADGVVQSVAVNPGDLLQQGAQVAMIARLGKVRVRFGVDPRAAQALHPGTRLTITGSTGRPNVPATITAIDPLIDPQTRLAAAFVDLPAGSGVVVGQALSATVMVGGGGTGVTIPYAALLDDAGQPFVYVVRGGVAHRVDVTADPSSGDTVTVTKGLAPGARVVVAGGTALEDGMKVRTR